MSCFFTEIFNNGIRFVEGASERQAEYPMIPPSHYNNDSNEVWFKAATIAVPICGAVILFMLMALAIRMLKTDSIDSPSKLGGSPGCSSSRKIALDFEANLKNSPLLKSHHNQTNPSIFMNPESDKKNETQAKLNQIMSIQYSLLPQSCHDPLHKPNNTDSGEGVCNNNIYRNVNLSLVPSNRSYKDASEKIYEKDVLNSVTANWTGNGSGSYGM